MIVNLKNRANDELDNKLNGNITFITSRKCCLQRALYYKLEFVFDHDKNILDKKLLNN
jgi:hypothetical protein